MCRSLAEGGRRCPSQGYSRSRENQAARQQLSRARRRLATAHAAGDTARITKAQAQLAAAQARVEASKSTATTTATAAAAAGAVRVADPTSRPGVPARTPAGRVAGAPAAGPTTGPGTARTRQEDVRDAINAFGATGQRGDYLRVTDLRAALPSDMTREEVDAVLRRMSKNGEIDLVPHPDPRAVSQADHDNALRLGASSEYNAANHLIAWKAPREPVRDPAAALQRIRDCGVQAADDADLKAVFSARDIDIPHELGREIWRERRRRQEEPTQAPASDPARAPVDPQPREVAETHVLPDAIEKAKTTDAASRTSSAAQPSGKRRATAGRTRSTGRTTDTGTQPPVLQVDGPPVDGQPSREPLLDNRWGDVSRADSLHYHSDGVIGVALERMGHEARMAVDGQPLHNVLGTVATEVVQGRRSAQDGLDAYKKIRDRLPRASQARQHLDDAIRQVDAPRRSAPALPKGTPEPLRQLAADLHAVPVCRAQPEVELDLVTQLANDLAAGKRVRPELEVRRLFDRRHESDGDVGYFEIRRAVAKALDALR